VVARSTGPKTPNCEFPVLLRRFAATAWKRAKTSPRTLARTDLAASPWQRPVSHFRPHPAVSGRFDNIEESQAESQRVIDTYRNGFPRSVPKMEETAGPVSICRRELLRGWWRPIGRMVSFMVFTASVRNILDTSS
jgi:hypothetical protein